MYPHSFLWHFLWLAPHALQALIAAVMVQRRLVRHFPLFFAYTLFQAAAESTLFALDHLPAISADSYWSVYWCAAVVSIVLRFAILFEIFFNVFCSYPGLRELSQVVFRWAGAALVLAALVVAMRSPQDGVPSYFLSRVHLVDLAVDVMQSGLWLLLLAITCYLRLSWRSFTYGVAMGLGIYSTVDVVVETMRVWTGPIAGYVFDFVAMTTYLCCVLVWLVYALAPERLPLMVTELPENGLRRWNAELQRLLMQ